MSERVVRVKSLSQPRDAGPAQLIPTRFIHTVPCLTADEVEFISQGWISVWGYLSVSFGESKTAGCTFNIRNLVILITVKDSLKLYQHALKLIWRLLTLSYALPDWLHVPSKAIVVYLCPLVTPLRVKSWAKICIYIYICIYIAMSG